VRPAAIPPIQKMNKVGCSGSTPHFGARGKSPQTQKEDGGDGLKLKKKMASKQNMLSKFLKEVVLVFA